MKKKLSPIVEKVLIAIISSTVAGSLLWFFFNREQPEIEFEAYFPVDSAVVFRSGATYGWDGERYAFKLREFVASAFLRSPVIRQYCLTNGYLSESDFKEVEKTSADSLEELSQLQVILPIVLRVSNKGNRDTTIVKCVFEFPTVSGGKLSWSTKTPIDLYVPRDQVKKIDTTGLAMGSDQGVTIPFYKIVDDALLDFMSSVAESSAENEKEFVETKSYFEFIWDKNRDPSFDFIDLEKEAFVTIEDQHGNTWPAKIDLKPARKLLREAFLSPAKPSDLKDIGDPSDTLDD